MISGWISEQEIGPLLDCGGRSLWPPDPEECGLSGRGWLLDSLLIYHTLPVYTPLGAGHHAKAQLSLQACLVLRCPLSRKARKIERAGFLGKQSGLNQR